LHGRTLNQWRSTLIKLLKLDQPKKLEKGIWVAVSYEDNWYPGEIIDVEYGSKICKVKFMCRKNRHGHSFCWPLKDDIHEVDTKFVISSHFEILPSPGLRHWIVPDMDDINDLHNNFVQKYF
jgi:hypothetical protein